MRACGRVRSCAVDGGVGLDLSSWAENFGKLSRRLLSTIWAVERRFRARGGGAFVCAWRVFSKSVRSPALDALLKAWPPTPAGDADFDSAFAFASASALAYASASAAAASSSPSSTSNYLFIESTCIISIYFLCYSISLSYKLRPWEKQIAPISTIMDLFILYLLSF